MQQRNNKRAGIRVLILSMVLIVGLLAQGTEEIAAASREAKPAQVTHLTVQAKGARAAVIRFQRVNGAKGYLVYQAAAAKGPYKRVKTLKGNRSTSCTRTHLKADTRYWYRVRAYKQQNGKRVYGAFSARKSVWTDARRPSAPGQVSDLKLQKEKGKLILTFSPVEGADGYKLYERRTGTGEWTAGYQELADLPGQANTRYGKTDAEYGVTYYFKVRAYKKGLKRGKPAYVYGPYSNLAGGILTEEDQTVSPEMPEEAPYQEVDLRQVLVDLETVQRTGQELYKGMDTKPYGYAYSIYPSGNVLIGYLDKWETECSSYNGSEAGPWYGANFALKLASSACTAYYTTDGSLPSPENGTRVTKAMGRVKLRAAHTATDPSDRETLDVKIHFYVKGKLVALRYYYSTNAACYHSYPEGNGLTVEGIVQSFGTLEAYLEWNRQYHREDWPEYLPENEALLRLKKEYPDSWWEQVPGDGRSLYW